MEERELNLEKLDSVIAGNYAISKLISLATELNNQGYTKEEIRNVLSKKFDLNNEYISKVLNSIYNEQNIENISKKI